MRYEDASQAGSISSGSEPIARPDVETLPPSSNGPGSGNAISGMGTNSGASGADQVADGPGAIVELRGAGGAGASNGNGFEAAGQYGTLSMDMGGNFNYVRTTTADGVQDVFQYTLADSKGARSSSTLTVEIPRVIDEQAMVNLPAGVQMSDIKVIGRDLVIQMPDGSQMVIPGGAVFVPELSIGDVIIPPTNLAALLIDSEPQPAAGPPQSSGGNFADDVPDLDPGAPLGDLIPPTELDYTPPEYEEPMEIEDTEPTIIIITPDNPAGAVNANASVDESGLPERGSEPEGTLESQNIETTSGSIVFTADDGLETVSINGTAITAVGQQIQGEHGVLTITSINLENGTIGYSYTATDNTTDGVDDFEDFTIVVTDEDGDSATGTLHIDILDDEPIARDDVDQVNLQTNSATGNVMTGVGTNAGVASGDTVGADDATLTAVVGEGGSDSSFDSAGNLVVDGEYGTLTIDAEGNYTYVPFADSPGGTEDVFTYTLTDGDGDVITATLTIINPDQTPTAGPNPAVQLDDDVLGGNPGGPNDDPNSVNASGTLSGSGGDGELTFDLLTTGAPDGFTYVDGPNGSILVQQMQDGVAVTVLTITVDPATGAYTVVQNANILHPDGQTENNVVFSINYTVTDADGDVVSSTLTVNVDDDTPLAYDDTETMTTNETQETGNVITGAGTNEGTGNADQPGADGFAGIVALEGANSSDSNGSNGFEVQGEFGTLTMDAEGNYTYVRDPNILEGGEDVFTYTYVDGDGDTVTATLTILVPDIDLIPVANPPADVIVDDDDVGQGGNPGGTGDDTPQNATGTLSATGGNGDSDFFFDVTATNAGLPTGFSLGAGSTSTSLLIMQGSTLVMTVTLNSETGAYTVVQNAPIDHSAGGNENNVDFDILFFAQDADGSQSPNETLEISVDDDTPLATDDTNTIASGQFGPVTGNVITNDAPGADGFGSVVGVAAGDTNTALNSPATVGVVIQGTYGDLTLNADGSYSYTRDPGTDGGVEDVFTYTYVDGDGDLVTATLTITIGDSTPVVPENTDVLVDDDDVGSNGNPNGTGDDAPSGTSGSVAAVGGDGTITYALSEAGAPAGFTYDLQANGDLWIMQGTTHVITVTLDASGNYTVTQVAPIDHAAGSNENNLLADLVVTFTATDADNQSDSGTISIDVDDDTPVAFDPTDAVIANEAGPESPDIALNFAANAGADGVGDVVFDPSIDGDLALSSDGKTLQFEGEDITYNLVDPYTLQGINADGELAFTIRLDPTTDTYTVDLEGPIYNISQSSFENVSGIGGGNDNYVALTASTTGGTSEDILISGSDSVNTNDNNIGIGSGQNIEGSETIKFEFKLNIVEDITPPLDPTGFTDDGFYQAFEYIQEVDVVSGAPGNTAGFDITIENALGAAPTNVTVTVYATDPNVGNPVPVATYTSNSDGSVTVPDGVVEEGYYIVVTSTDPFTSVEYSNNTGDPYKLGEIQVEVANTLEEFDAEIPIIGTDGDGDAVGSEIIITFDPVDSNGFAATSMMAEESQSQSADMSATVVASNDNADHGRAFVAGNQAALMGVIAAAGIETSGRVAEARAIIDDIRGETVQASGPSQAAVASVEGGTDASQMVIAASADAGSKASLELQGGSANAASSEAAAGLEPANDDQAQAVSALAAGTDAHAGADHAASAMTAAAVTMPGAEMIAALEAAHQSVSASGNASVASNQEVGRVLADALAGGSGPDIGALVDAIGGGGADSAREALASLKAAGVSNGHTGEDWGFAKGHEALSLDALALHHDAPPAA